MFAEGDAGFCAVRAPGAIVCWGRGFGPEMRALDDGTDYVEVAVGAHGICGLRRGGEVRCGSASAAPAPVAGLPPAVQLGADDHRTCALTTDGQVFCLGEANTPPAPLTGVSGARRLSVADRYVCVVEADAGVRCLSDFAERPVDDRVPGLSEVVDLRHSGLIACGRGATGGPAVRAPAPPEHGLRRGPAVAHPTGIIEISAPRRRRGRRRGAGHGLRATRRRALALRRRGPGRAHRRRPPRRSRRRAAPATAPR